MDTNDINKSRLAQEREKDDMVSFDLEINVRRATYRRRSRRKRWRKRGREGWPICGFLGRRDWRL